MAKENTASGSSPMVWLLGLIAAGAAALFGLSRIPDQPQAAKNSTEPTKYEMTSKTPAEQDDLGPLHILREYLRVEAEGAEKTANFGFKITGQTGNSSISLSMDGKPVGGKVEYPLANYMKLMSPAKFEFLIATVPDPVETKLPHEFDAVVESIQRAFEAQRFTLRTFRLPWSHVQKRGDLNADVKSTQSRQNYPGVMLFQKIRGEPDEPITTALVCLVGESPIFGIHKPALSQALSARQTLSEEIAKMSKISRAEIGGPIRIIAPYFSGSQFSHILTLEQWKKNRKNRKG